MKHIFLYLYKNVKISEVILLFWLFFIVLPPSLLAAEKIGDAGAQDLVQINFPNTDLPAFIQYISEETGKSFIVDRTVKGKITVISPTKVSKEDAYRIFESVLEVHGYTTVSNGGITKIVQSVKARSKNIPTIQGGDRARPRDKVVTQIIPLIYSNPNELKKILTPLISKTSVVIAHDQSGMLIITDVESNIKRLLDIIKTVDVPSVGEELVIIPLKYASVTNVGQSISQLFVQAARKGIRPATIKIIPYERTNSLIVFAPRTQIDKIINLLEQLDSETTEDGGKIHVYYLQHANAEELVKVLTTLPTKKKTSG
ncbi:MAG: type II secretion system protein GspD, partial [Candidatus Electrothrix sp. AR3]|nr:type II secretion system protein GspD [Candidatus Electrothrix sp. AR3]